MPRAGSRPIRAVIFDYGLTLVTFSFPTECLLATLERFRPPIEAAIGRQPPDAQELLTQVLLPLEDLLSSLGEDEIDYLVAYAQAWRAAGVELEPDLLYRILDAEQLCWDASVRVAPDAFEVLGRLRSRGLRTVICSNAPFPAEMMHRQVADNGLAELVDAVVFSSEVGRRKPAPEMYQAALARVDAEPGEALSVGDRLVEDYQGAVSLGMRAVLCTFFSGASVPDGVPHIAALSELEAFL